MIPILVLNDGDTWSGIDGSSICLITEEDHEMLCQGAEPSDIQPVLELSLTDVTPPPLIDIDKNQPTLFDEEH